MTNVFIKDPNAVLDYEVDWTDWLDGDTISTSTWTVPTGITKNSDTATSVATTIWLSGGSEGGAYVLTNRIVTGQGRTNDQSITIKCRSK